MTAKPSRRLLISLGVAWAFAAPGALAQERLLPADRVFPNLARYLALPPSARDRFEPIYVLIPRSGGLAGARAWLIVEGRRRPLLIAPDGRIAHPVLAADVTHGQVAFSFPPGARIGLRASIVATIAPGPDTPVVTLQASLAQANAALHTGTLPFVGPPRLRRLVFQGAEGGVVVAADGRRVVMPIGPDGPYLDPEPRDAGSVIRFRRPPTAILLRPG
jgi:hypothetical protein